MGNRDRIYEAYTGRMGEHFQTQVHRRIEWMIDQVGNAATVWDIGCSQGIVSLLLAEKGKQVTGIDIDPENLAFAKNLLAQEYPALQQNLSFVEADFFDYQTEEKADCIIIAEVLEHLQDPGRFLQVASRFLGADGTLVLTVPFGVNNHPEHYSTFYMAGFYALVSPHFAIAQMEFLDGWMGLVAHPKNKGTHTFLIDQEAILWEEEHFLSIDTDAVSRIETLSTQLEQANKKYRDTTQTHARLKEQYGQEQENSKRLQTQNIALADALQEHLHEDEEQMNLLRDLKRTVQKLTTQNEYLAYENQEYHRKLSKITDTWWGKIAIRVYRLLQRILR